MYDTYSLHSQLISKTEHSVLFWNMAPFQASKVNKKLKFRDALAICLSLLVAAFGKHINNNHCTSYY